MRYLVSIYLYKYIYVWSGNGGGTERRTYKAGRQVVEVGMLQQLPEEGHQVAEHIAVGARQLGHQLPIEQEGDTSVNVVFSRVENQVTKY